MTIPEVIVEILGAAADLVLAKGDEAKEEEALMRAAEATKRALDRKKFGANG